MRFKISWGPLENVVDAPNKADAWSKFCELHPDVVYRHPKLHTRKIEELPKKLNDKPAAVNE